MVKWRGGKGEDDVGTGWRGRRKIFRGRLKRKQNPTKKQGGRGGCPGREED
jgi:hypothetical protein